jgi:4-alpha-glucanotransferase
MGPLAEDAARLGIETEYWDALGRRRTADPEALARLIEAMSASHGNSRGAEALAASEGASVEPKPAYQGVERAPHRCWVLAVQLYGVRSHRNWGHGDFADLTALIDLAAEVGAGGIGLNPLHALFDEWAEASPYSPNSRLFLNPRYIDVEAVPEFPGVVAAGLESEIKRLRSRDLIDYAGVIATKTRALRLAFDRFCQNGDPTRGRDFEHFRHERGALLTQFACFEHLRRRWQRPWQDWPPQWQRPDAQAIARLAAEEDEIAFYEYMQWIAHEQLARCRDGARARDMTIGLYVDIAVGVRADGFDSWSDQDSMVATVEVGAPPDLLNMAGQKWGVVGFNPIALAQQACEPFRRMLRASMRYAGAIRLDHVMGLARLFLIPSGMAAEQGMYVRFPFAALLEATAAESRAHGCIVIGEDLGTVPENFRETAAAWGLWSYQVVMFERDHSGAFRPPDHYRENALATFSTHDLATFLGWREHHDLEVKRALNMDPGESDEDRGYALAALCKTLGARELPDLDYPAVVQFLAAARSRLVAITLEDVFAETEQVNVPGTIDEHPNWRRRTNVALEDFVHDPSLHAVADIMAAAGRSIPRVGPQ